MTKKELPTIEDLMQQLVTKTRECKKYKRITEVLKQHTEIWICPKCGNIVSFETIPDSEYEIKCQLCEVFMQPYSAYKYDKLLKDLEELDTQLTLIRKERNDYAKTIQEIIPVMENFGYNRKDSNPREFLEATLGYQKVLEDIILKLKKEKNME